MTKEEALRMLESMLECNTPIYTCDCMGGNENYGNFFVDEFFNEDLPCYLPCEEWAFTGIEKADPKEVDMEVWAQEFTFGDIQILKRSLLKGELYIASFHSDAQGTLKIIMWD